jgi:hypothetical protein
MNKRHRSGALTASMVAAGLLAACAADEAARRTDRASTAPVAEAPAGPAMAAGDGLQFAKPAAAPPTPPAVPPAPPSPAPAPAPAPPESDGQNAPAKAAPADALVEVFPHIRINRAQRLVEFDGFVPIDAHHPDSPLVFLEVVACTRGTKEHEALVVTDAKPSEVHAALLLIGLEPGAPGSFRWDNDTLVPIPAAGDPVTVSIAYRDEEGVQVESNAAAWIKHAETGKTIGEAGAAAPRWVIAGSAFVTKGGREMYDADGAGTLIGLATFGSETVAFTQMITPEASLQEPVWVAAGGAVPRFDTPVIVRLRAE